MEVGEIYEWASDNNRHLRKYHGKLCIYMGEDVIERPDNVVITNHRVMMLGDKEIIIDRTCLKYLYRVKNKK